jgi:pimeloyl-ACP methyl ester carboxylesterase
MVLCYPFAQEYMRAHRAFRQLSLLLSGKGFHTLRFDYSGTGDSSGEPRDMSLAAWDSDLGTAIEELMDVAGGDSVWVVGLRLGGALALRAAARPEVHGIVLWDPIVSGRSQLEGGRERQIQNDDAVFEVGGVGVPATLRDELLRLDLMMVSVRARLQCLIAASEDVPRYRQLEDRLRRDGAEVSFACVPSDGRWGEFDNWGSALIPQALIRQIVEYLEVTAL